MGRLLVLLASVAEAVKGCAVCIGQGTSLCAGGCNLVAATPNQVARTALVRKALETATLVCKSRAHQAISHRPVLDLQIH